MFFTALLLLLTSFVFIFLKSWQQLNVVHHQLWWIVPTSFLMAVAEVFTVANMAHYGWGWVIIPIGLGSGFGSLTSTILHKRTRKKSEPIPNA